MRIAFCICRCAGGGNWSALEALQPDESFVVAPVDVSFPMSENVMVMSLDAMLEAL